MAPQVGFGSEYGIDSIGSYWFYCNASKVFVQKCLVCTSDLSHVTDFREHLGVVVYIFEKKRLLVSGCFKRRTLSPALFGRRGMDTNGAVGRPVPMFS